MTIADLPTGAQVTYNQQYRRCGKAGCSRCAPGRPGHGPYWYASWSEGGRRRSLYLGKQFPDAAAGVVGDEQGVPAASSSVTAAEPLRVRTLGGFAVWRGATPLPPDLWRGRRAIALFKCLLSTPGHRLQREQAMELLWPEAEPGAGAANLRTTIRLLRQILDGQRGAASHLRQQRALLALAPAGGGEPADDWLDATAFARAAQAALAGRDAAACRVALALYGGEYLPDDPYAAWAEQLRASLQRQHLDLLLHLAALSAAQGEPEEAEACLRRVLAAEPSHEGAAATLMGLLAASGRRGEALVVYQQLATVLEDDLGVAPTAEVVALRAQLLAQQATPPGARLPPRQDLPIRPTNLPAALTSFVGRNWEVSAVTGELAGSRLVTLIGPGGCGKTRLALAVADQLVEEYSDGVWLVELAALTEAASGGITQVPRAVAGALGVAEHASRPMLDTLRDFLRHRRLLLVLDNCEHLLAACAGLATDLLRSCPHLRLLATSRECLNVPGEYTYLVPSLAVPDPDHLPGLEQLSAYEAVQLFLERARARRPDLALAAGNAGAIAQICARLDGLPLAIELAAARAGILPVEAIASRLGDRFRLLTGGPRTALPRQQTLRATLDWSHALLDEGERALLRRLAVFAGGCTLEATEMVCSGGRMAGAATLDVLGGLVQKSLVLFEDRDGAGRYRLLETVRQYGWELLEAAGEGAATRDLHLAWCISLGEQAVDCLLDARQMAWLDRLEAEHDNLRAALRWSIEQPSHATAGVQLAGAIWRFWRLRGHLHEGRRWLAETLARGAEAPAAIRARALNGAAALAHDQGDVPQHLAYGEEGLRAFREAGDPVGTARVLVNLSWEADIGRGQAMVEEALALARGAGDLPAITLALTALGNGAIGRADFARAQTYLEESAEVARGLGDKAALEGALGNLAQVALSRGEYEYARALLGECLSLQRALNGSLGIGVVLHPLGETAYYLGETAHAVAMLEESLALFRELGHKEHRPDALEVLARILCEQGDFAAAAALLEEGLSIAHELGHRDRVANALKGLGRVAREQGDHARAVSMHRESLAILYDLGTTIHGIPSLEELALSLGVQGERALAARLLGTADAAREARGMPLPPPDRAVYDRSVAAIRGALGEEAWAPAFAAGRATPLEAAIALALETAAAPV